MKSRFNKKRIIALFCAVMMSASVLSPAYAAQYSQGTEAPLPEGYEELSIEELENEILAESLQEEATVQKGDSGTYVEVFEEEEMESTPTPSPSVTEEEKEDGQGNAVYTENTPTVSPAGSEPAPLPSGEPSKTPDPSGTEQEDEEVITIVDDGKGDDDGSSIPQEEIDPSEAFNRLLYNPIDYMPSTFAVTRAIAAPDDEINIRKRAQWVDKMDGDAKITLEYEAVAYEQKNTKPLNVILIQDKSGSMDSSYGINLAMAKNGWTKPNGIKKFPLLNTNYWSETIKEEGSTTDIESEGAGKYMARINEPSTHTAGVGAAAGHGEYLGNNNLFYYAEMRYNAPCQVDGHYYLVIEDDEETGIPAWTMASGKVLYNIERTDIHHYEIIEADPERNMSARDVALDYLQNKKRRVVRCMTGYYINEEGIQILVEPSNPVYFLDTSELWSFQAKWLLNTCPSQECQESDRLFMSQKFMKEMVDQIYAFNPSSQIAYIPFFGDVPENGEWKNYRGTADGKNVEEITSGYLNGSEAIFDTVKVSSKVGFTGNTDKAVLEEQISRSFTYSGTNWYRAFEEAYLMLKNYYEKTAKEEAKDTIIIFLTDGMPQGTEGSMADYKNKFLNAEDMIKDIHEMSAAGGIAEGKIGMMSIGTGVSGMDETDLKTRLEDVNTQQFATTYAANVDDMMFLTKSVVAKLEEANYTSEYVYGYDAFYHDKLSNNFELDTSNLDSTWTTVKRVSGSTVKGVPSEVYNAVMNGYKNGTYTKTHIYVESTKTVYWFIPELTEGGFTTVGHKFEFPVKYNYYNVHTSGKDSSKPSNDLQKMTYYWYGEMETETMTPPQLVFNRAQTSITVTKNIMQPKSSATEHRFVFSTTRYSSGTVGNIAGELMVTIPAGATSGTAVIYDLPAAYDDSDSSNGTEYTSYFVYEVDANNRIINPEIRQVRIGYRPSISTVAKSASIPYSVTTSEVGVNYGNENNYLKLEALSMTPVFSQGAELTVIKEIDSSADDIHWDHGNPTFVFRVKGTGTDGKTYTFYHTFEFTKEYVEANRSGGKVSMSYTFTDIPVSTDYVVQEVKVSRYKLDTVSIYRDGSEISYSSSSVGSRGQDSSEEEFFTSNAHVNLKSYPTGVSVKFYDKKANYEKYNHTASVKNIINW